jgi:hypothetical protein
VLGLMRALLLIIGLVVISGCSTERTYKRAASGILQPEVDVYCWTRTDNLPSQEECDATKPVAQSDLDACVASLSASLPHRQRIPAARAALIECMSKRGWLRNLRNVQIAM